MITVEQIVVAVTRDSVPYAGGQVPYDAAADRHWTAVLKSMPVRVSYA